MNLVMTAFLAWRFKSRSMIQEQALLAGRLVESAEMNRKKACFHQWKIHVLIVRCQWQRHNNAIEQTFMQWKYIVNEAMIVQKLKLRDAEEYDEERKFKRLSRVFDQLVSDGRQYCSVSAPPLIQVVYLGHQILYSSRKRRRRMAYIRVGTKYCDRLLHLSLRKWKEYCKLALRQRNLLLRIITRRMLLGWMRIVLKRKESERIRAKIILNRWRIYTEDQIERRNITIRALHHWARYKCRAVIGRWRYVTIREKGCIRTPRLRENGRFIKPQSRSTYSDYTGMMIHDENSTLRAVDTRSRLNRNECDKRMYRPLTVESSNSRFRTSIQGTNKPMAEAMHSTFQSEKKYRPTAPLRQTPRLDNLRCKSYSTMYSQRTGDREYSSYAQRPIEHLVDTLPGGRIDPTPVGGRGMPAWVAQALSERGNTSFQISDDESRHLSWQRHIVGSFPRSTSRNESQAEAKWSTAPGNNLPVKETGEAKRGWCVSLPGRDEIKPWLREAKLES